jgi:hypothetical protein
MSFRIFSFRTDLEMNAVLSQIVAVVGLEGRKSREKGNVMAGLAQQFEDSEQT